MGRRNLHLLLSAIVLLVASYLRLMGVGEYPGWHTDEGTIVELAQHMSRGQVQYLGISRSFLFAGRMPGPIVLLALAIKTLGASILTLRLLVAFLTIISALLMYWAMWIISKDLWWTFSVALMYAILPRIVFYQRLGFSYHLGGALAIVGAALLWLYWDGGRKRYLVASAAVLGLGIASDLALLAFLIPVLVLAFLKRRPDVIWAGLAMMIPVGACVAWMCVSGNASWYEWQFVWSRVTFSLPMQIAALVVNFVSLWISDPWWGSAWIGLLFIPDRRQRAFLAAFWGLAWLGTARSVIVTGLGYYHQIPVFPLWAIGVGSLLRFGLPHAEKRIRAALVTLIEGVGDGKSAGWLVKRLPMLGTAMVLFALLSPLMTGIMRVPGVAVALPIEKVLLDASDAQSTIAYVNQRVRRCDLVVASPTLAWAIDSRVTGFQVSQAYLHHHTAYFPADMPHERFAYNADYHTALYAVIDPVWRNWGVSNIPAVREMTTEIQSRWHLEKRIGEVAIYRNPESPVCH